MLDYNYSHKQNIQSLGYETQTTSILELVIQTLASQSREFISGNATHPLANEIWIVTG